MDSQGGYQNPDNLNDIFDGSNDMQPQPNLANEFKSGPDLGQPVESEYVDSNPDWANDPFAGSDQLFDQK